MGTQEDRQKNYGFHLMELIHTVSVEYAVLFYVYNISWHSISTFIFERNYHDETHGYTYDSGSRFRMFRSQWAFGASSAVQTEVTDNALT